MLNLKSTGGESADISVYNMIGAIVYSDANITTGGQLRKNLDLSALSDGIYFLKIAGKDGMVTRKLVIKK